ncbi:MAG: hypothetical protein OXC31_07820 [Spirochaetaceae bacterium]|nr:hypothetical protein [Spirochaetaceae bacterium]
MQTVDEDLAEWIESEDESIQEVLCLVFDELDKRAQRLIVVLNGFDCALAGTDLTRNLRFVESQQGRGSARTRRIRSDRRDHRGALIV